MTYPIETYSTARGFCQCAMAIVSNPARYQLRDDVTFVLGFHHLIGFAVELYLKAYLSKNGVPENELRGRKYGHNLQNLLAAAQTHGFSVENAKYLVSYLEMHGTFEFRYMNSAKQYQLRPIDQLFDWLNELDSYVDQRVGARASFGLSNDNGWGLPKEFCQWRI